MHPITQNIVMYLPEAANPKCWLLSDILAFQGGVLPPGDVAHVPAFG